MKMTLRVTLTTTLVTLIFFTVLALGYNSHRNAQFTAEDLSDQILDQTSKLVEAQVSSLVNIATSQGDLNLELLRDRQFDTDTFHKLARYWISVLKTHPRISRQSIGIDASGEWSFIRRISDGKLVIGELRRNSSNNQLELRDYWPEDYSNKPFNTIPDANNQDPRHQHWYSMAVKARQQIWSKAYIFDDVEGFGHVPGVSCSTPIFKEDGTIKGVMTTSFDVISLCDYLRTLKVGKGGFAFVVETLDNGKRHVIAHPDPKILIREIGSHGGEPINELAPVEALGDSRIPAFLGRVPTELEPARIGISNRIGFSHEGVRYIGAYRSLGKHTTTKWLICIVMPEKDVMGRVSQSNRETTLGGLAILVVALMAGLYVSTQVARPLERVVKETMKIGKFEVEARPVEHSFIAEVDHLGAVVEETKTSLRSFGKYVPTDVIRQMFATGQEATLGGDRRRMTISFCDLANFTSLAEKLPPEELVSQMGDYFSRFSADIAAEKGTVDKYIGDAIMAFWGAPAPSSDHAVAACATALRNLKTLEELNIQWRAKGMPELNARVGIMTGEVVVGNIGSPARLNYTAMGDSVNLASRLEGLGKYYGTTILIGDTTYHDAREVVLARAVDWVSVKGKSEGMLIYELLALKDQSSPKLQEVARLADYGLKLYRSRDWESALAVFDQIGQLRRFDGPSKVLAERCREFIANPPGNDWDGIHRMTNK